LIDVIFSYLVFTYERRYFDEVQSEDSHPVSTLVLLRDEYTIFDY